MTPLIILGILAAIGMTGLTVAVVCLCRTLHTMGNQLIANSDHQIERIRLETAADARPAPLRMPVYGQPGYAESFEQAQAIPDRSMPERN